MNLFWLYTLVEKNKNQKHKAENNVYEKYQQFYSKKR